MRVTNMGGRVIATKRAGVRSYHQHDALGNTIALINDSGVVTDTYTYWPYGELRTSTGSTVNPFKFCGAWGYYTDTTGRTYVRARTLRPGLTRWMTVDPLWPSEHSYIYAALNPVTLRDSSGLSATLSVYGVPLPNGHGLDPGDWKHHACGKHYSGVNWRLTPVGNNTEGDRGVIVQLIDTYQYKGTCPPIGGMVTDFEDHFYEMWYVKWKSRTEYQIFGGCPNENGSMWEYSSDPHDLWLKPNRRDIRFGKHKTIGSAYYIHNPPPAFFNGFTVGGNPKSQDLCSVNVRDPHPGFVFDAAKVTAKQSLKFHWECCCFTNPYGLVTPCSGKLEERTPPFATRFVNDCPCPRVNAGGGTS
ncbi:MAG: RHS repeat-associated core domain-containing protein [Fimbriimonadaceae bacterium]